MARQWLLVWPPYWISASALHKQCHGEGKWCVSAQKVQWQTRGGKGMTSSPRCGARPHIRAWLPCWDEPGRRKRQGSLSWVDRVCPCVQRGSAQAARHSQSGRLPWEPACASMWGDRFNMSTWSNSVLFTDHKNKVLANHCNPQPASLTLYV